MQFSGKKKDGEKRKFSANDDEPQSQYEETPRPADIIQAIAKIAEVHPITSKDRYKQKIDHYKTSNDLQI